MNVRAIITGSTGMVGKAALIECLDSEAVEAVLVINRRPIDIQHPKLKEVLLSDFTKIDSIKEQLRGYNACFHCMGVSAVGMSEAQYTHITYDMTKALADTLYEINPDLVFEYVSGVGTDSSEKGSLMWGRVKGRTENMLLAKGFKDAYALRPGGIIPEKGVKSSTGWYNFFYAIMRPFFPLMKKMDSIITSSQLGKAMINSALYPNQNKVLEVRDLKIQANK
ncbi:NAD-dependent epimerase/dehydratase family protein [Sediminitomix flava]|uniref:NAD-dependent epimerase/dehydratase family protein n=1 Tax=Sediminitomix flava TaxID=379075 RepID=A0A315ZCT0_SEDFL|nr:NAD-dependent epimerase/dehydratase family protein [Sediminitomix flava]PWJ42903.1 NAD-dependent epimerase/dehydratase family protein [Sediminitomix flava]